MKYEYQIFKYEKYIYMGFSSSSDGEASASNAGDLGSIPGLGRSPENGNDNPFQYSCLENPMDREAWWATVYGVTKSWTRLSDKNFHFTFQLNRGGRPEAVALMPCED